MNSLAAFIASPVLAAVTVLAADVAPTGGFDPTTILVQLGFGGIIAGPFIWLWRDERKQRLAADARLVEFLERQSPLLAEAAHTLEKVQDGMEHAVERSQQVPDRNEWDRALRRVELVGDDLREELRRHKREGGQGG